MDQDIKASLKEIGIASLGVARLLALALLVSVAYWPIARGCAWLLLAVYCVVTGDRTYWPGPYTPYPPC